MYEGAWQDDKKHGKGEERGVERKGQRQGPGGVAARGRLPTYGKAARDAHIETER